MRTFISGGCKNGKSHYAERLTAHLATDGRPLYYIATMLPCDEEDTARISRHRVQRSDLNFITVEQPFDIGDIVNLCDTEGSFLLDSTTALLSNEMFADGEYFTEIGEKISDELRLVFDKIRRITVVSDFIYADGMDYDGITEQYRKTLADLDRLCAERCETVAEFAHTLPIIYIGAPPRGFSL